MALMILMLKIMQKKTTNIQLQRIDQDMLKINFQIAHCQEFQLIKTMKCLNSLLKLTLSTKI